MWGSTSRVCTRKILLRDIFYVAVHRKSYARSIIVLWEFCSEFFFHIIDNARSHEGGSAPTVGFSLAKFPPPELARGAKSSPAATPAQLSIISHRLQGTFLPANTIFTLTRIVLPEEKQNWIEKVSFLYILAGIRQNIFFFLLRLIMRKLICANKVFQDFSFIIIWPISPSIELH